MTKKKTKPVAYVPPPEPVRTPEEQARFDVELLLGAIDMELRSHDGRMRTAIRWAEKELAGDSRFLNAGSVAQQTAALAEAQGAHDALTKVRQWLAPIVKHTGACESAFAPKEPQP